MSALTDLLRRFRRDDEMVGSPAVIESDGTVDDAELALLTELRAELGLLAVGD